MTDGTDELEPTSELSDRNLCDAISLVWGRLGPPGSAGAVDVSACSPWTGETAQRLGHTGLVVRAPAHRQVASSGVVMPAHTAGCIQRSRCEFDVHGLAPSGLGVGHRR
jgi:hypothetical protein